MITIRPETPSDRDTIHALNKAAFKQADEANLVDALRHDGDAEISLVATDENNIVGHVMLSRMEAPVRALGLAPIAVSPEQQKKGIGSKLMHESLKYAKEQGWEAVFLLGDPTFYTRFGFSVEKAEPFTSPYAGPYFMTIELKEGVLKGKNGEVHYAKAFSRL